MGYNFFILPLLYTGAHIAFLFNSKIRHGIIGRHFQWSELKPSIGKQTILFHTASLGEYEHIRPLYTLIKKSCESPTHLVNMFFSPSGYRHAESNDEADQFIYAPFDTPWAVWRLFDRVKPTILVIAKHDVWPSQLWMARAMEIPVLLINASMSDSSSRLRWWSRWFHRSLYRYIFKIYTISKADKDNLLKIVSKERLFLAGDTKFDQVSIRKEQTKNRKLLPAKFRKDKRVLVLGSVWPSDLKVLFPVLEKLLTEYSDLNLLIVPHEPSQKHLKEISGNFPDACLYSQLKKYKKQRVIMVDAIGVLADLYKYAHIAYVGGSFKEGVHNVMEAAVYSVPVIYGPVVTGSNEAEEMAQNGCGGFVVNDQNELHEILDSLLNDSNKVEQAGTNALNFVMQRLGASQQISDEICRILSLKQNS